MATTNGDDDDARYRAAHEPAALWHAYLARRQRENPLFLRRTLSFVPGQPTIGGPAAPAPAPDRAVGRYLRLRLPAAALSAAGAPRWIGLGFPVTNRWWRGSCSFRST